MSLFPLVVATNDVINRRPHMLLSHHVFAVLTLLVTVLFIVSIIVGCARCLVCSSQESSCLALNWLTVARITALGTSSRLYAICMWIFGCVIMAQSELHSRIYNHSYARRVYSSAVGVAISFRLFFPENVYSEAHLPLLDEVQPEGDGGRALSVVVVVMFTLWAILNMVDTHCDERVDELSPKLAKQLAVLLVGTSAIVAFLCRYGTLDWPLAVFLWECELHVFIFLSTITSMWETHKLHLVQKLSSQTTTIFTLSILGSTIVMIVLAAIIGCEACTQCYSTQPTCRDLHWVSLARITPQAASGRLYSVGFFNLALGHIWQALLFGMYLKLGTTYRVFSAFVSLSLWLAVLFPQHVLRQGDFVYASMGQALPKAEPEATLGSALDVLAMILLFSWNCAVALLARSRSPTWLTAARCLVLLLAGAVFSVYVVANLQETDIIFSWGTEIYMPLIYWVINILLIMSTIYETRGRGLMFSLASPDALKATTSISPCDSIFMDMGQPKDTKDKPPTFLDVRVDSVPQSRRVGFE